MLQKGLPDNMKEEIVISNNGTITIQNLSNSICLSLIANIHLTLQFGKRLYCNGYIPLTPLKKVTDEQKTTSPSTHPSCSKLDLVNSGSIVTANSSNNPIVNITSPSSLPDLNNEIKDWADESESLVRRHSISLLNRTPPKGSLAEDILMTTPLFAKTQSIMDSINDIKETLSDFASCQSTRSTSSSEEDQVDGAKSLINIKLNKKRRKKCKNGYDRSDFVKKPNNNKSPQ